MVRSGLSKKGEMSRVFFRIFVENPSIIEDLDTYHGTGHADVPTPDLLESPELSASG